MAKRSAVSAVGPSCFADALTYSQISDALVAIEGSKLKAANHRDRNFTSAKLERRMQDIEASIGRYPLAMDRADRQEPAIAKARTERLQDKIAALKEQMRSLKEIEVQLNAAPDGPVSPTDPDARSMKTRGTGVVGYNNVQRAADAKHHPIVAHEVNNNGIDRDQLTSMAKLARTETGVDKLYRSGGSRLPQERRDTCMP